MCGRLVALVLVVWVAVGSMGMGTDISQPLEGVQSFVTTGFHGERVFVYRVNYTGGYYGYVAAGWQAAVLDRIGGSVLWAVTYAENDGSWFSFVLDEGIAPIRSPEWAARGIVISDVRAVDGSLWIDPMTGHEWGWVGPPPPPPQGWGLVLDGWAAAGFVLGGVGVLALGGRF